MRGIKKFEIVATHEGANLLQFPVMLWCSAEAMVEACRLANLLFGGRPGLEISVLERDDENTPISPAAIVEAGQ